MFAFWILHVFWIYTEHVWHLSDALMYLEHWWLPGVLCLKEQFAKKKENSLDIIWSPPPNADGVGGSFVVCRTFLEWILLKNCSRWGLSLKSYKKSNINWLHIARLGVIQVLGCPMILNCFEKMLFEPFLAEFFTLTAKLKVYQVWSGHK